MLIIFTVWRCSAPGQSRLTLSFCFVYSIRWTRSTALKKKMQYGSVWLNQDNLNVNENLFKILFQQKSSEGLPEPPPPPIKSSSRHSLLPCRSSVAAITDEQPHVGNYRLQKTIGKGNFAKVKLARHILTNREVRILYGVHVNNMDVICKTIWIYVCVCLYLYTLCFHVMKLQNRGSLL